MNKGKSNIELPPEGIPGIESLSMKAPSDKRRGRPTLWLKSLIVGITLVAVVVVVFLGSKTNRETRKMAIEQFNQYQLSLARSAASGIEAYFKELRAACQSLAKQPSIQRFSTESMQYMQHTYWGFPLRTSIRLLDSDGILRLIYPFDSWRGELIGRDYSGEAIFKEVKESRCIGITGMVINEQGEQRIRMAVPVYLTHKMGTVKVKNKTGIIVKPIDPSEPDSGRFQGVLLCSFDPYIITQDFISPIISGKTGYAWVLNEDSVFLSHYEEGFTGRNAFDVRVEKAPEISYETIEHIQLQMMAGEEGVGCYISGWHRGQKGMVKKLIAYTPVHINNNKLSVAVCAPISEVEEIIHKTQRSEQYTLVFVIMVLIIGGLSLFIISYRWSHSLELEVVRRTRKLRETRDYLDNLIRYANAPIIVWDPKFKITQFNHAFEHLTGYGVEEVIGKELNMLFPKASRDVSLKKIESTLGGEHWESVEIPILRKDGDIRVALWNSENIYGEDDTTLLATIAQGMDITERKKAEEELQLNESRLKALFELGQMTESTLEQIAEFTLEKGVELTKSKIGYFGFMDKDETSFRMYARSKNVMDECVIVDKQMLYSVKDGGILVEPIRQRKPVIINDFSTDDPRRKEFPEGYGQIFRYMNVPIFDGDKIVILAAVGNKETEYDESDIRQLTLLMDGIWRLIRRKRAEEELEKYSEQLEVMVEYRTRELKDTQEALIRKEKLAVLGQLAGSMGHELRNPLGVISNAVYYLQIILPEAGETAKEYLEIIASEVRNAEGIISDLLNFSRTKPAEKQEIMISELIAQVLEKQISPKGIEVIIEIPSDLQPVFVDSRHIRQVLINLVTNAYQSMPKGGRVIISAQAKKEKVSFSITDTGVGISAQDMKKIFEPLFTTKERGIGLGLVVSKNLVEVNGGTIEFKSEEGKGSTFTVILPTKEVQS